MKNKFIFSSLEVHKIVWTEETLPNAHKRTRQDFVRDFLKPRLVDFSQKIFVKRHDGFKKSQIACNKNKVDL